MPDMKERERLSQDEGIQILNPPSVDLFMAGLNSNPNFPSEFAHHPILLEQAQKRRELYELSGSIFDHLPNHEMGLHEAVDGKMLASDEVVRYYDGLAEFLETDPNNGRIILYLPFQILPDLNRLGQSADALRASEERFIRVYKETWIRLLFESEARASFVDGDVLEPGLGEPAKVRKAGHLIPQLLGRGILQKDELKDLLEIDDVEIISSLTEGLLSAQRISLVGDQDWMEIQEILKRKLGREKLDDLLKRENPGEKKVAQFDDSMNLDDITQTLETKLQELEMKYMEGSAYAGSMSHKRAVWEKQVKRQEMITDAGNVISRMIQNGEIDINDILELENKPVERNIFLLAGIRGIFHSVEKLNRKDPVAAIDFAKSCESLLLKVWGNADGEIRDEIYGGLSHFLRLKLISDGDLQKYQIEPVELDALIPVEPGKLFEKDLRKLSEAPGVIGKDPYLSKYLYPFFVTFGSRIKGYARSDVDFDMGIFFKPETPVAEREGILKALCSKIPELGDRNEIPEFWLEEKDGKFTFRQVPPKGNGVVAVGAPLVHFLLGGVWFGKGEEMGKVQSDLLGRYLNLDRLGDQKERVRIHLLRQLEMDVLQYRLMHKGFRWLYPDRREERINGLNLIDGQSDFYDPGYRRVATRLFLSKVFLPDLPLTG
jgi:hypothetical protein